MKASLSRRMLAELLGTGLLVTVVVGSGIAAQTLSRDTGVQLLANALATTAGLAVLILVFGPISGAHFNPVVSLADWLLGRRSGTGLAVPELVGYLPAQVLGAIGGAVLANAMFARPLVAWSTHRRSAGHLWLAEIVATAGLLLVIVALARAGRGGQTAWAVGAYIGAAYWFTSSTAFANPAVTIGRAFSDTFAGIAPASVPAFLVAQLAGGALGMALIRALFPDSSTVADRMLVPHPAGTAGLPESVDAPRP
ncbi:MAG TPA: MIP/aquaporin family protein [Mycobacteriales bacterium]|nr:MIP/aquaporin family protein [Mycobacteriales bacterium]